MGRYPNHRFSATKEREITTFEAKVDLIKRYIIRPFKRTKHRRESLGRRPSGSKKREGNFDRDEPADSTYKSGSAALENGKGGLQDDKKNTRNVEDDPYIEALEELGSQMALCQKKMRNVRGVYCEQMRAIRDALETRNQLSEMTKYCQKLETTIETLNTMEKGKDKELAKKFAKIEEDKRVLDEAKKQAADDEKQLEEKKARFDERVRLTELEQQAKLSEQKKDLERRLNEQNKRHVEKLERETKERQDSDEKRIAGLEAKKQELEKKFEEQKDKLKQTESKCKDAEMLRKVFEERAERLSEDLKAAENEFGLNTETTEY
ncbi:hypothetical protein BGZ60DRAFT_552961 [Tricladium varicosporioides]|nr:hypothetical protein BGZ60DRAFT_552961 [Hymenoscyphus varicosporioides]